MEQGEYSDELDSTLNDLLAAAKGSDLTQVSTNKLVAKLESMGYNVSSESLLLLLNNNPFVSSADETQVTLTGGEGDVNGDNVSAVSPENNELSNMAQAEVQRKG